MSKTTSTSLYQHTTPHPLLVTTTPHHSPSPPPPASSARVGARRRRMPARSCPPIIAFSSPTCAIFSHFQSPKQLAKRREAHTCVTRHMCYKTHVLQDTCRETCATLPYHLPHTKDCHTISRRDAYQVSAPVLVDASVSLSLSTKTCPRQQRQPVGLARQHLPRNLYKSFCSCRVFCGHFGE